MIQALITCYSNKIWGHLSIAKNIFDFSRGFPNRTPRFSKYFKNVSSQKCWGVLQIIENNREDCVESLFWAHKSIENIYFWESHVLNDQPTPKTREGRAFWRCVPNSINSGGNPYLPWLCLWNQWWNFIIFGKSWCTRLRSDPQKWVFHQNERTTPQNEPFDLYYRILNFSLRENKK